MNANELTDLLRRNLNTIKKNADSLSDEQANCQAGQGASLNWTVGHVLATRMHLLSLLKLSTEGLDIAALPPLYGTKTHPDAAKALPLAHLLEQLELTQSRLEAGLQSSDLTATVDSPFGAKPLGDLINFFMWHEGYHAGQTVIFRHLALD